MKFQQNSHEDETLSNIANDPPCKPPIQATNIFGPTTYKKYEMCIEKESNNPLLQLFDHDALLVNSVFISDVAFSDNTLDI